jgi:SAM-dependent methyltransferase
MERDERAIKDLYVELGADFWEQAVNGDLAQVPVLSAPETLPVVVEGLRTAEGSILDAGCGPNPAVGIELALDARRTVVVLDLGWGMVRTATEIAKHRGVTLHGVAGDLEHLPFRDGAFDGLVCDDTIEHVPDDVAGVAELARVMRPGGRALLATPNRWSAAVIVAKARDLIRRRLGPARDYYVASSHLREYTWRAFESLVDPFFELERRRPVGWIDGRRRRALTRFLGQPGFYRVSQMIVVECRPRLTKRAVMGNVSVQ